MGSWKKGQIERLEASLSPLKCKFVGFNIFGNQRAKISPDDLHENDLILGYDEYHHLYFAWNAHVLRILDKPVKEQTLKCEIKVQKVTELLDEEFLICPKYQRYNSPYSVSFARKILRDKMVIVSESFIEMFCENPFRYLIPNTEDEGYCADVAFCMPGLQACQFGEESASNLLKSDRLRSRYSCSRIARDNKFRKRVFEKCGNQCVICGLTVPCTLQAAHIVAVHDGGSDDPSNGIVLCANHHLMHDAGTYFTIDTDQKKIKLLDESISDCVKDGLDLSAYL